MLQCLHMQATSISCLLWPRVQLLWQVLAQVLQGGVLLRAIFLCHMHLTGLAFETTKRFHTGNGQGHDGGDKMLMPAVRRFAFEADCWASCVSSCMQLKKVFRQVIT